MRTKSKGLVSIVMPCFNSELTIKQAINSVIKQDYINWELIIVDDFSTDNSVSIIKSYLNDRRIKLIRSENNAGVAEARNKALRESIGEFICFLDADDFWISNKLTLQLSILNSGICDCVHSSYYRFSENHIKLRKCRAIVSYKDIQKNNFIGNLTGMYNCERLGVFYQKDIGHEDYLMWLEIINKSRFSIGILEPLAFYRMQQNSLSSNKLRNLKWHYAVLRERYSFLVSMYLLNIHIIYIIYAFFKD